jgi:hypothetical protein
MLCQKINVDFVAKLLIFRAKSSKIGLTKTAEGAKFLLNGF